MAGGRTACLLISRTYRTWLPPPQLSSQCWGFFLTQLSNLLLCFLHRALLTAGVDGCLAGHLRWGKEGRAGWLQHPHICAYCSIGPRLPAFGSVWTMDAAFSESPLFKPQLWFHEVTSLVTSKPHWAADILWLPWHREQNIPSSLSARLPKFHISTTRFWERILMNSPETCAAVIKCN